MISIVENKEETIAKRREKKTKRRRVSTGVLFVRHRTFGRGIQGRALQRDASIYLLSPGTLNLGHTYRKALT